MNDPTDEMMAAAHEAYRALGRVDDEATFDEALRDAITAAVQAMPREMVPVKIVLFNRQEERDDELDLGTFNQGVHFERGWHGALSAFDTATGNEIAVLSNLEGWAHEGERFPRLHVQALAPVPTPASAGAPDLRLSSRLSERPR